MPPQWQHAPEQAVGVKLYGLFRFSAGKRIHLAEAISRAIRTEALAKSLKIIQVMIILYLYHSNHVFK